MAVAMGAFGYVTSAGNPQVAADSKGKILSALFGLALLLGAVVMLNMINPDLLRFKKQPVEKSVEVTAPGDDGETKCKYIRATWTPMSLKPGGSATLTLDQQNCSEKNCCNDHEIILDLYQVMPGGKDATLSEVILNGKAVRFDYSKWVEEFSFPYVINLQANKPEELYLKGKIRIPNQPVQYIPEIKGIIIEDGQ
jgi:hypothetical protein